jgi:metallo-beta-lactamase class B
MTCRLNGFAAALASAMICAGAGLIAQTPATEAKKHTTAAELAAQQDHAWLYNRLCNEALGTVNHPPPPAPAAAAPAAPGGPPPRGNWHAEPLKVFDNVYWLGQTEYSAWAINTPDGIILMDAIFDYSVEDEVIEGLKKVGLDPSKIKYAIMGHWHGDHAAGAKTLQDRYGTKIIMGAADWDNLDKQKPVWRPKKDIVATDGMKVTLGGTTVTVYVTPGHTAGTLSSIIPVTDNGTPHTVAYWGGTMFNWINRTTTGTGEYVGKPESYWFRQYADTAVRFKDVAASSGADIVLSNHTQFDGSKTKMPQLAQRKTGDPHPFVVGADSVQRYLTVVGECARAGSLIAK